MGSINTIYTWDFRCRQQLMENMRDRRQGANGKANDAGRDPQTARRIRDQHADRRTSGRTLFEAALEDQELFNALQNEDALKELLDDPVAARSKSVRALVTAGQI